MATSPVDAPAPASQQDIWLKVYRREALARQGGACCYCFEPMSQKQATADHRVPKKHNGPVSRENIVAACQPCNCAKGSMTEQKFKKLIRMPGSNHLGMAMAIFRYRLWKRTRQAEERILKFVGMAS